MADEPLTLQSIQALLDNVTKQMMQHMTDQFNTLNENITANRELITAAAATADAAKVLAEDNQRRIDSLEKHLEELEGDKNRLAEQNAYQTIQINVLNRRLEDQTNRNSRNSIIIKGIPEREGGENSWDETRDVVCNALAPILDKTPVEISRTIERIHRGPQSKHNTNTPRLIHARMYDWNTVQWTINTAFKNRNNSDTPIYVEQRYGPDTTYRRQEAMKFRKDLKTQKLIVGGYVKYPAKLYVKYPGTEKYILKQDFSDIPVTRK